MSDLDELRQHMDKRFQELSPVSQGMFLAVKEQLEERFDEGHGRLRETMNQFKAEMQDGFRSMTSRLKDQDMVLSRHADDLLIIKTERFAEKEATVNRKQDQRDRTALLSALTATVVSIVLFILTHVFHL